MSIETVVPQRTVEGDKAIPGHVVRGLPQADVLTASSRQ